MAQVSDYNIANASGASVRSDLNAVFSAIKTLNSGGSDPANPEAFMLYVDTADNNNLKIRNSANNAFTTIGPVNTANLGLFPTSGGTLTGVLTLPNQSAGTPSINFGDSTTGFFRKASNQIGVAASGTEQLFLDQNGVTLNLQNEIRFGDANSSHYIGLKAPTTITSNFTLSLPAADGSNNQFLTTNGSGTLNFAFPSASDLTGSTLASNITASSLTSVGTLSSLTVSGSITGSIASSNISGALFTLFGTSINRGSSHTSFTTITATNSRVTNLQDSSGGNNSTPNQIQQGRAKAWVNFNGTGTVAIRDDFNVSSITDNGNGDYNVNIANNMSNSSYAVVLGHDHESSNTRQVGYATSSYSTSTFRITIELPNTGFGQSRANSQRVTAAVFGD